ncbi:MAG: 3-deoxy-D-manno-octulosonate 8-phosphate phosphatase [Hadesarchaea archaeon]|nr:MAG: 3-deoxy-D-manno-octulosonate 8-phosphate phosphatase [Hadesarchaea archaeon]
MKNRPRGLRFIKLVAFDFDGVFTDNRVYVDQEGREMIRCWRSDGVGLAKLREIGVKSIVITSETNPVVKKRCAKLKINCITGCKDKLSALKKIIRDENFSPREVCFVGNDLPDIECMRYVGFPVAVKDSLPEVLKVAKYVTRREGGSGAVREVCDLIHNAQKTS